MDINIRQGETVSCGVALFNAGGARQPASAVATASMVLTHQQSGVKTTIPLNVRSGAENDVELARTSGQSAAMALGDYTFRIDVTMVDASVRTYPSVDMAPGTLAVVSL